MNDLPSFAEVGVERQGHVAIVELRRPPFNFFSFDMICHLADAFRALDDSPWCRSIVLAAEGKAFSAGAEFGSATPTLDSSMARGVYEQAVRLFETRKPIVAAVHGAAVGGGLGLALVADFRVTCHAARFSANFARLGVHCGFGISTTLPRLIGVNPAALMLLTGRRLSGTEAREIGLADQLVPQADVRSGAIALAVELAACSPIAVQDMRQTLRQGLADAVRAAVARELRCQTAHAATADLREGIKAYAERREPVFRGV